MRCEYYVDFSHTYKMYNMNISKETEYKKPY